MSHPRWSSWINGQAAGIRSIPQVNSRDPLWSDPSLSDEARAVAYDVVGPVCETGDYLAQDRSIEGVEEGDLLAIMSAGAYGAVMASSYNSRPLVPEVLVDGDRWHVIRARPSIEALIGLDSVPDWV